jgi:hypothetical protein
MNDTKRYLVKHANGSTVDLVNSESEAFKIAKANKAQVFTLRAGKLVRIG